VIAQRLGMTDLELPAQRPASVGFAASPVAAQAPDLSNALQLEGDYWAVSFEAQTFRIKDSRGLRLLWELIQNPGREFHVLELAHASGAAVELRAGGDAGPTIDPTAKAAYRERIRQLREESEEAERWHDEARLARCRRELEALTEELARGVGLGGRDRIAASAVERARVNIQRRVSDAIRRIASHSPALGAHLTRSIKTGIFCCYRP
jgi:non-specific serine/threonine protein kinase